MERIVRLLILCASWLSAQDEFIFWAELSSKDLVLVHQSSNLSSAMTESKNVGEIYTCELSFSEADLTYLPKTNLGLIDNDMPKALKFRFLNAHKDELIDCFNSANIKVRDKITNNEMKASSQTFIQMLPLRFRVDFSQDKALIYQLIKEK